MVTYNSYMPQLLQALSNKASSDVANQREEEARRRSEQLNPLGALAGLLTGAGKAGAFTNIGDIAKVDWGNILNPEQGGPIGKIGEAIQKVDWGKTATPEAVLGGVAGGITPNTSDTGRNILSGALGAYKMAADIQEESAKQKRESMKANREMLNSLPNQSRVELIKANPANYGLTAEDVKNIDPNTAIPDQPNVKLPAGSFYYLKAEVGPDGKKFTWDVRDTKTIKGGTGAKTAADVRDEAIKNLKAELGDLWTKTDIQDFKNRTGYTKDQYINAEINRITSKTGTRTMESLPTVKVHEGGFFGLGGTDVEKQNPLNQGAPYPINGSNVPGPTVKASNPSSTIDKILNSSNVPSEVKKKIRQARYNKISDDQIVATDDIQQYLK